MGWTRKASWCPRTRNSGKRSRRPNRPPAPARRSLKRWCRSWTPSSTAAPMPSWRSWRTTQDSAPS
ncbi:hypothetical protein [Caudoviricetes sp.]|nr:hypothetical protein [Caudoviricetes sp.]